MTTENSKFHSPPYPMMYWARVPVLLLTLIVCCKVCNIPSTLLHLGNLPLFIFRGNRRLHYFAPLLPLRRVNNIYLKIWGVSWSDRRARAPGGKLFRSGPSHAMLRARGGTAFWVMEFGGEGWARSWETLFAVVEHGGGFSVLLQRLSNGYRNSTARLQQQSGKRKRLWERGKTEQKLKNKEQVKKEVQQEV